MADPLYRDPLDPAGPPPSAPGEVPAGTIKADGSLVMPSDSERLRRAYATSAGVPADQPLSEDPGTMIGRVIGQRRSREAYYTANDMPSELDLALTRYVPIPRPGVFTPQQLGRPNRDNPPTGTLWEGVKAGFREDTLLGSILEHQERKAQIEHVLGPIRPTEGYSSWLDPQLDTPERKMEMWRYVGSQSMQETALRIAQVDERRWNEQTAAIQGTSFTVGRVLGGLTDPTLLLTSELGLAQKALAASRAAGHVPIWGRLARGVEIGSINMAQTLAIESIRNNLDPSYTSEGLADMMMLAGGIGGAVGVLTRASGGLLHSSDPVNALRWDGHGSYQTLLRSAPDHPLIMNPAGGYFGHMGDLISAGAAATPYMAASHWQEALEAEGLKSIFGLEKFGLTPVIRGLASRSLLVREFMAESADLGGLKQNKNVWNAMTGQQKTAFPVEAEVAVRWKAKASEAEEGIRSDWLQSRNAMMGDQEAKTMTPFLKEQFRSWFQKDGQLSFNQFTERAAKAVANGNKDLIEDAYTPFVEKSARRGDGYLKELSKHAQETGLFKQSWERQITETRMELAATMKRGGEERRIAQLEARLAKMEKLAEHGPQVNTGPNYYPRMYRHDQIAANEADWTEKLVRHFKAGGASEEEARRAAAAATTEITHSNFRPIHEDNGELIKQASDPGSVKFRTLEIPDMEIADYLDWDLIGAIRHQTATMAPAIEMMRRWGDPSLKQVLLDVQSEYEGLIGRETNGTRRVQLQNEMKQSLEDMQAVRDRLLNVAGASKDPHSWNERTIRMLKHYTAWTTLGLSAVSQLGDLFRPVITEGLDATHRYGFLTLMDASRAEIMRMAQRERMMAGDGMELATGAASLSFSNIGDTYHSRSRLERQANQLSGAYFMLNGLTFTTDMTKRWGGLIVQGNLNNEIMEIARTLRVEMGYTPTDAGAIARTSWGAPLSVPDAAEKARTYNAAQLKDLIATGERHLGRLGEGGPSGIPTREEFDAMVGRGRMQYHEGPTDPRTPLPGETEAAMTKRRNSEWFTDLGRLYGYPEDDIAWFYSHHERFATREDAYNAYVDSLREKGTPPKAESESGRQLRESIDAWKGELDRRRIEGVPDAPGGLARELPAVPKDHVRLYRIEGQPGQIPEWLEQQLEDSGGKAAQGRWFTRDPDALDWYRRDVGEGARLAYVDVPKGDVEGMLVANSKEVIKGRPVMSFSRDPTNEFFVSREMADGRKFADGRDHQGRTEGGPEPIRNRKDFDTWQSTNKLKPEDGSDQPLMVYHGTQEAYARTSNEKLGSATRGVGTEHGHFFAASPDTADFYANYTRPGRYEMQPGDRSLWQFLTGKQPDDKMVMVHPTGNPQIRPTYIRMENPKIVRQGAISDLGTTGEMNGYEKVDEDGQLWRVFKGKWHAMISEERPVPKFADEAERKAFFMRPRDFLDGGDGVMPTRYKHQEFDKSIEPRATIRAAWEDRQYPLDSEVKLAKAQGHDGIVFEATQDVGAGYDPKATYLVFDEKNVKAFDERYDVSSQPQPKQLPEFNQFMDGNAVKDADGNPILVYHGTSAVYDRHSNEMLGSNTKASSAYMGHFFAGNPQTASSSAYVGKMAEDQKDPRSFFEKIMGRKWTPEDDPYADSPNIRPTYLRMTNPHIVDDLSGEGTITAHAKTAHRYEQIADDGVLTDASDNKWFAYQDKWYPAEGSTRTVEEHPDMTGWTEGRKRKWLLSNTFTPGQGEELGGVIGRKPAEGAQGVESIQMAPRPGQRNLTYPEVIEDAKALGKDGVIIRNTVDSGPGHPSVSDSVYIVFDPETQIRNFDERWDVPRAEHAKRERIDGTAAGEQVIESQAREQVASPAAPPRPINAHMMERLHSLSVDANDILAMADQLETHGKAFNSIHMANSDEWLDKDAQMLYRGMIGRALNRTVITPGIVDRPTWMTTSVGSLIGQFKAFGMASTIRTLGAGLQDNDRQFWTGAAALVGSGVVLNELRNQLFYDKSSFDQPFLGVLADGLDRSGVLGSLMDVNNAVETVTNNKVGLRPLVGAGKNMPVSPEKFASTFFGPAAGKTVAAGKVIGEIMSGNADARTWRDMRGFAPGQNIPYIDPIADRIFPKPPPRERAAGSKSHHRQAAPDALTLKTPVTTEQTP